jgi:hypothetical protein
MQNWYAIRVPFDVKRGDTVMFSPSSGELVPVLIPDFPKQAEVAPHFTREPEAQIHNLPLRIPPSPMPREERPPIKPGKTKTCVKRPAERLKSDREMTLSLVAKYPAGLPVSKVAELIHSAHPTAREKAFAQDDCRWLAKQGLVALSNVPSRYSHMGQSFVKPAQRG